MLQFDPGAEPMAARSRLAGRRRVADALVKRDLAAAGYLADAGPRSPQRGDIGLALVRIKGRSQAPVQPVHLAFNETPDAPGVAPRALDYGMGRATPMPLQSPARPTAADAPGRYSSLPTHRIGGDAPPMVQLVGTGASQDSVPQRSEDLRSGTVPNASEDGLGGSQTGYILPLRRDGETGALSPAIPGLAREVWDEAVSAATLPGDVYSGKYHLPSLGEPGITEDDGYNVYRDGQLLGNRLANQMSLTNRAIGAAATLTGGGTGFAATRGARSAMDPSLLRMGGGGRKRPPRGVPSDAVKRAGYGQEKPSIQRVPPYKRAASGFDEFAAEISNVLNTGQSSKGSLFRKDLGEITIDFGIAGDPKRRFKGGYGLEHILQKRTAQYRAGDISTPPDQFMLQILPRILSDGRLKWIDQNGRNAFLTYSRNGIDYKAVLSLDRHGDRETWVLTGMERYPTNTIDKWGRW